MAPLVGRGGRGPPCAASKQLAPPSHPRYDMRELDGLPAPVQRYFSSVLREGQTIVAAVTLEQTGALNMSLAGDRWKLFTSLQRIVTSRPGFI